MVLVNHRFSPPPFGIILSLFFSNHRTGQANEKVAFPEKKWEFQEPGYPGKPSALFLRQ